MIVCGLDLSMRHFALVMKHLETNRMHIFVGWHNEKALVKWRIKGRILNWNYNFCLLPLKKKEDGKENSIQKAANELKEAICGCFRIFNVSYLKEKTNVSIEGYAYKGTMVVDLAEITGVIKHLL